MDGFDADQVAQDKACRETEGDLGGHERTAAPNDVGEGAQGDLRSHADVEDREDRKRSGEESARERPEEGRGAGRKRRDDRSNDQRYDHHAAGNSLQGTLDGDLHGDARTYRFWLGTRDLVVLCIVSRVLPME